jgi:DNA-3-methyladenine glycosylase I
MGPVPHARHGGRIVGRAQSLIDHDDGLSRCGWPGTDPLYVAYHDEEWGVPEHDSRALFEKLLLDGFQAGLSWITILRKRDAFRRAFDGFDPERIASYDDARIAALMADAGIVRNRAKIEAAVTSARAYLALQAGQEFSDYLWGFVDGRPVINRFTALEEVPAATPLAETVSKDLKARGFRFCGPTIVYAFMQAVGMVNDHWSAATAMRHVPVSCPPFDCEDAQGPAARLAAHAVGPPARSSRPLAARHRDRGHRAGARPGGALERPDQGRTPVLGGPALAAGGADHVAPRPRLRPAVAAAALLHDAPEYVIGDLISPFKAAVGLDYKALENRLLAAIHLRFGLPASVPEPVARLIKRADRAAAFLEATRLAGFGKTEAAKYFGPIRASALEAPLLAWLEPLPPDEVRQRYLKRFAQLR